MYLKYHKALLTPTTPVTSIAMSPVKMSIGRKSLTNLRSEMIFLQGKAFFLHLPTIYTPILTDNLLLTKDNSVAAKGKVGHVTSSAFRCKGNHTDITEHYLLHCNRYTISRTTLFLSVNINHTLYECVVQFIKSTKRFSR